MRLAALGGVDSAEPHDRGTAAAKDRERVPVGDGDDPAGERLGRRRPRQQEKCDGEGERVPSPCAAGQGVQDGRRLPYPPGGGGAAPFR
jgi:hypothetical protein